MARPPERFKHARPVADTPRISPSENHRRAFRCQLRPINSVQSRRVRAVRSQLGTHARGFGRDVLVIHLRMLGCRGLVALGMGLVVLGCGSGGDGSPSSAGEYCSHLCTAAIRCRANDTVAACTSRCESNGAKLNDLSQAAARELGNCVERLSCSALFDTEGWEATWQSCWNQSKLALHPTREVEDFCARYTETLFECSEWLSVSDCEQSFSMWHPRVVAKVDTCAGSSSCSELGPCVEAVFSP